MTSTFPFRAWLAAALVATLGACATSPPVTFYQLQVSDAAATSGTPGPAASWIIVGPFRWPDYLDRPQIVVRGPGNQLELKEFERWAEPLDESFLRTLTLEIDGRLDDVLVAQFPTGADHRADVRVTGRVYRFDIDAAGEAVLDVQWAITIRAGDEEKTRVRRQRFTASASPAADTAAGVAALNRTLTEFGEVLAEALDNGVDGR